MKGLIKHIKLQRAGTGKVALYLGVIKQTVQ